MISAETVRFLFDDEGKPKFVYKPNGPKNSLVRNGTLAVKFAERRVILDEWWLIGGTRWSRTLFRMRHPMVYSKRGLFSLYLRVRRLFVKDPPIMLKRIWVDKKDMVASFPEKKE